jgi:hypothetical protein
MLDHFYETMIGREYERRKGRKIDWDNPRDINEKIYWLMSRTDTSLWSYCADKVLVREYVSSKGLGDLLIPSLGVWDRAEDIDFDSLPDKFVLKCNHDSGSFRIVDKTRGFDPVAIRDHFSRRLGRKIGYINGELYYNKIKPKVLAEPFLGEDSHGLIDYKIRCFGGKPFSITTCSERTDNTIRLGLYDLDWNPHPESLVFSDTSLDGVGMVPKPACLDRMLEVASILSEGFPQVRVDLYVVGEKIYFGELTFSSGGRMSYFTDDYLVELGRQCVLPVEGKTKG